MRSPTVVGSWVTDAIIRRPVRASIRAGGLRRWAGLRSGVMWRCHDPRTGRAFLPFQEVLVARDGGVDIVSSRECDEVVVVRVACLGCDLVGIVDEINDCLLYTSPSPRDGLLSRMP